MLIGSQMLDISRLWFTALMLSLFLPPVIYFVRQRREWFYSFRGVLVCILVGTPIAFWLRQDLQNLRESRRFSNVSFSDHDWEWLVMLVICSSLITYAVTSEQINRSG